MSDEFRPNETPRWGETADLKRDDIEILKELKEAREYVEEKVNDYTQNEVFDPDLQRWLETFDEREPNVDKRFSYDLCLDCLLSLSEKIREELKHEVPPTEEGRSILAKTIKFIDSVLAFTVEPELRHKLFETKASILIDLAKPLQGILPTLSTLEQLEFLSTSAEETMEASLAECKKIPEKEEYLKFYQFLIQNRRENMGLLGLKRVGSRLRTSCEEFLGNDGISENKARELRCFLVNPSKPRQNHPVIKYSLAKAALAGLCCRLLNVAVFDKLKGYDIVFDRCFLRNLRDRYIRDIFFQESSYVLRNEWEAEGEQISFRTEVPDITSLKQTHPLNIEDIRELERINEYRRTLAFNETSAGRNSALVWIIGDLRMPLRERRPLRKSF